MTNIAWPKRKGRNISLFHISRRHDRCRSGAGFVASVSGHGDTSNFQAPAGIKNSSKVKLNS